MNYSFFLKVLIIILLFENCSITKKTLPCSFSLSGVWSNIDSTGIEGGMAVSFKRNMGSDSLINNYVMSYEIYTKDAICSDLKYSLSKFYYDTNQSKNCEFLLKVRDGECGLLKNEIIDSFNLRLTIRPCDSEIDFQIDSPKDKEICCIPDRIKIKLRKND